MTQATTTRTTPEEGSRRAWAYGGMIFAATMLVIVGVFQLFQGIAVLSRQAFYVVGANYLYSFNTTGWGWVHIGVGAAAIIVGVFLYTGALAARVLGVIMAGLSAIANFFFSPYYPLWAILIIALDVFVIWALVTVGSRKEIQEMKGEYMGGYAGEAPQSAEKWRMTNEPSERARTVEPGRTTTAADTTSRTGSTTPTASTGRREARETDRDE